MEYSLSLALFDFVPILAFLSGAYFLVRIAIQHRGTQCGRMMMAGTGLVFTGGFLKAAWKLLYVLDVGDFQFMSQVQFILLAIGFSGMLVAASYLVRSITQEEKLGAALMMATWKIPFLTIMTLCSLGAHGILSFLSFKKKAPIAGALFVLAILCMLGMSGMASSLEQTVSNQWLEEGINSLGQISFAVGSYLLYRVCRTEEPSAII